MNILLIHQYFLQTGGSGGSRFNEMTRVWEEMNHKVTVLTGMIYHNSGKKYPEYEGHLFFDEKYSENIRVIRCHDSSQGQKNFIKRLWVYFSFVFFGSIAGLFKAREKYDVIIVSSPPLTVGIIALILSVFKKIPYVFEVRDLWPESAIDTGVLKNKSIINFAFKLEKYLYKKSLLINVLTPAFKSHLIQNKNIAETKIIEIPNAADFVLSDSLVDSFDPINLRIQLGIENVLSIIYVGAHGVANNLIQVINVAEKVKEKKVKFLLVGDGMEKKQLELEVQKRELTNIIFLPPVSKEEVFKYILASDIGASILKKADTFKTVYSNKTFDYMACKKPIFMLIDGVSRELVEEANCGEYIEPENTNEFANKINEYLQLNETERQKIGLNGYNFAKQHFNREFLAKNYIDNIMKKLNGK